MTSILLDHKDGKIFLMLRYPAFCSNPDSVRWLFLEKKDLECLSFHSISSPSHATAWRNHQTIVFLFLLEIMARRPFENWARPFATLLQASACHLGCN